MAAPQVTREWGRGDRREKVTPWVSVHCAHQLFPPQKCTTGVVWHTSALQRSPKLQLVVRADGSKRQWGLWGSQTADMGKQAGLAKHATCSAREEQPAKRVTQPHEHGWVQWMLTLVVGPCALDVMSKRCDWFKETSRSNFMLICTPTTSLPRTCLGVLL